jgi:RNA polymerase sigma-70 factor (ECF subfamily)
MTFAALPLWLAELRGDVDAGGAPIVSHRPDGANDSGTAADDHTIIEQLRAGDAEAFEQLYVAYYPRLYPYAIDHARDAEIAAEVVHDVFLALWRRRAVFTLETTLKSYLYVAVRNRAVNTRKRALREPRLRDETEYTMHVMPASSDVAADVAHADLMTRIWDEVQRLAPARREALTLRWRHGLSPEEIGRVLGVTEAAAKMQVSRALQTLRERLAGLIE